LRVISVGGSSVTGNRVGWVSKNGSRDGSGMGCLQTRKQHMKRTDKK